MKGNISNGDNDEDYEELDTSQQVLQSQSPSECCSMKKESEGDTSEGG